MSAPQLVVVAVTPVVTDLASLFLEGHELFDGLGEVQVAVGLRRGDVSICGGRVWMPRVVTLARDMISGSSLSSCSVT